MCVCVLCVCVSVQERNWFLVSSQKSGSHQAEEREGCGGGVGGGVEFLYGYGCPECGRKMDV